MTGLVFHAIQRPDFQRDLWRTLPAKNHAYVSWAEELLAGWPTTARISPSPRTCTG